MLAQQTYPRFLSRIMTSPFDIFDATIVEGLSEQMNVWGSNLETSTREFALQQGAQIETAILQQGAQMEAALRQQSAQLETIVYDLKSAFLTQATEMETIKNGTIRLEMRTDQLEMYSGKAVAELDVIMTAFRAELVKSQAERAAEGEALKGELRQLVADLQAKFLEMEGAIGTLTATAAAATATGPSR